MLLKNYLRRLSPARRAKTRRLLYTSIKFYEHRTFGVAQQAEEVKSDETVSASDAK